MASSINMLQWFSLRNYNYFHCNITYNCNSFLAFLSITYLFVLSPEALQRQMKNDNEEECGKEVPDITKQKTKCFTNNFLSSHSQAEVYY